MKYTKIALALMLAFVTHTASAEEPTNTNTAPEAAQVELTPQEKELEAAYEAAGSVVITGPSKIPLIDQGVLNLPEGYSYIPTKEAARLMNAMGNYTRDEFVGILTDGEGRMAWFIEIDYTKSGYIKDEEAKDWDVDGMLESVTQGTHDANKQRAEQGIPALEVSGWAQKPVYDAANHKLVWSILLNEVGQSSPTINYNTYALGREGYFELTLVTDNANFAADKPHADAILAAIQYNEGKNYKDFNASTDKVAEYGIAALVAGVAAKKLGLLAVIGVFLLKIWKVALVAVLLLGTRFKKIFKRKKSGDYTKQSAVNKPQDPKDDSKKS